jgi:hypothetical protein
MSTVLATKSGKDFGSALAKWRDSIDRTSTEQLLGNTRLDEILKDLHVAVNAFSSLPKESLRFQDGAVFEVERTYFTSPGRHASGIKENIPTPLLAEDDPLDQLEYDFSRERRFAQRTISQSLPPKPSADVRSQIKEQWVGLVIAVSDDSFEARLKRKSSPIEEEAEFPFVGLEGISPKEIREGRVFDWVVGTRNVNGTQTRVSHIYFRRTPVIEAIELTRAWEKGHELLNSVRKGD